MTANLPALIEPLTPPDCDLRVYPSMPLHVQRFRDSGLVSGDPEEGMAAIMLWCASWHQLPAASLPNDDRELAKLAGYGKVVSEWLRVKEGALRSFVLCSDGRLYHPVVAEVANESWASRQKFLARSKAASAARHPSNKEDAKPPTRKKRASPTRSAEGKGSEGKGKDNDKKDTPPERPATRGSRLPPGWFADEADRAYAREKGFAEPEIDACEDAFRDWWPAQPGQKGVKVDWKLTWKTWIRTEKERRDERARRSGSGGAGASRGRGAHSTESLGDMHAGFMEATHEHMGKPPSD